MATRCKYLASLLDGDFVQSIAFALQHDVLGDSSTGMEETKEVMDAASLVSKADVFIEDLTNITLASAEGKQLHFMGEITGCTVPKTLSDEEYRRWVEATAIVKRRGSSFQTLYETIATVLGYSREDMEAHAVSVTFGATPDDGEMTISVGDNSVTGKPKAEEVEYLTGALCQPFFRDAFPWYKIVFVEAA